MDERSIPRDITAFGLPPESVDLLKGNLPGSVTPTLAGYPKTIDQIIQDTPHNVSESFAWNAKWQTEQLA